MLCAWREFLRGKRDKIDVQVFGAHLMDELITLRIDCVSRVYCHGAYQHFRINDPRPRDIHKASVRDRVLHHAIYRQLYPFFDRTFIADSFSCRIDKGVHRALDRLRAFAYRASANHTRTAWVLQCDIQKFFANIDHQILLDILKLYIPDPDVIYLLNIVIDSFHTQPGIGLPLGNLTSQLFVNIYMNAFDQFAKHQLHAQYYLRYADDFLICSHDRDWLQTLLPRIADFLNHRLRLQLHPRKISLKTIASGIDFLGWVHFPDCRVLRTSTKRRMLRRLREHPTPATKQSYRGLLKHGNTFGLQRNLTLRGIDVR